MRKNNRKGFTIVELVIVIAVIAILAGVLIPTFASVVTKANESAALQEAQNVYKELYALDLSDGKLDYNYSVLAATMDLEGTITGFSEGSFTYTTSKGYDVTMTGTTWTVNDN